MAMRKGVFGGANVFLSRNLVPPEVFDALHDALKLNGAQVFLCCDPSRTAPNDYHVISSSDHEKFADLRAKGCNILGPQCILFCAKEHKLLPKQGYTCCFAMDGVKVLASGFEKDEKVLINELVTAMGGELHNKASRDVSFVIVKNVLAAKYKWALNVLKKPIVNMSWLKQCWTEHRVVPHEPFRILPFTGLIVCVTRIPAEERKEIAELIVQNGGIYSADLTKKCTHLVSDASGGDKYVVARRWGHIHIVTRRWVDQSIARRACLDEELYSVHESCVSTRDMRGSQKEQRYLENSNATSQIAPPLLVEDLEATLSQNVYSSFSDAAKIINEGTDAPAKDMKDQTNLDSHIAEDSESEDNDLYLSNCRIFLVGFGEVELSRLVLMIRKGGGTRHMLLSEKLTHIIIGSPSEIEKKEVRRLAAWGVINVVKATWLEECDKMKKELAVSTRHLASDLVFTKDSSCFSLEPSEDIGDAKKVKGFPGISILAKFNMPEGKQLETELCSEGTKGGESYEIDLKGSSFAGLDSKSEQLNKHHARKKAMKESCKMQANFSTMDDKRSRSSNTFTGKTFCFSSSFPQERRAQVIEWVKEGGGVIVDDPLKKKVHFIVASHGVLQFPNDVSQLSLVSTHWIRSCLEEGCIQDVGGHIIYSPLRCHIPLTGFESLRFCVSQYEEKERLLLRNLCFTLGAKFTEKLTRRVTHLLCKFTSGPKYEAACKWGIQPVTADWINECISQDKIVALDPFRPKPVSAQDREAGLCTVSQYPTQATHMVSGCTSSQLLSEPLGANEIATQITVMNEGLCEESEHFSALCKRSRLSERNSITDGSKKIKLPENIHRGTGAVPDVADAIEDLLAQSSKIQDLKSPGSSSCDQTIFSPDHSILGQGNNNSNLTFGISRSWINRTPKQESVSNTSGHVKSTVAHDSFSETQTESQVVGYEEDLTGRQKIIDRVRSQSMTLTPDK